MVEEQWCWSDYGDGYANTETGTYIPKTVGFDRFIGYNKECNAAETSYVVGFTDVLYAPMLLEGQTLEGYLRYHQKEYQELFYQTDYRIERPGLALLSNILDGVTFGGTALIRSSTGYNIVTKEVLTDADQAMAGIQGSIVLCSSVFMFVTAGVSGASIVYVLVANGVEVVATETAQAICKELGLSPTATIAITALTRIMVAGGMSALLVQMNRAGAVQLGEGALEVAQSADGLVKPNQLDEIVEVGDDAAKAYLGGSVTGTVWDNIKATQLPEGGNSIPKSFTLTTKYGDYWVNPNATKHMLEYSNRGFSHGLKMTEQELLTSFDAAVNEAVKVGYIYNKPITINHWELIFSPAREGGQFPVIKHALYIL